MFVFNICVGFESQRMWWKNHNGRGEIDKS